MNCRIFESNLADYVAGRLNPADTALMSTHSEACPACAHAEQRERSLSARFALAPEVPAVSDIWPRLAMQLPERRRRFAFPRLWIAAPVFTAAALAFFWFQFQPLPHQPTVKHPSTVVRSGNSDKTPMTNYVIEVRNIGVAETDMLWEETRSTHQLGIAAASEGGP